jgi:hypothetical protein
MLDGPIILRKQLFSVLVHLSELGYYPREIIEPVLSLHLKEIYNFFLEMRQKRVLSNLLLTINIGISCDDHQLSSSDVERFQSLLKPYVTDAISSLDHIIHVEASKNNVDPMLKPFVDLAFGDKHFVKHNVWTSQGHFIDHLVVMQNEDKPVELSSEDGDNISKVDEMHGAGDGRRIIAILPLDSSDFCREPRVPKRRVDFKCRTLKAKNITAVPINMASFDRMPEREKIPFLVREVNTALEGAKETMGSLH